VGNKTGNGVLKERSKRSRKGEKKESTVQAGGRKGLTGEKKTTNACPVKSSASLAAKNARKASTSGEGGQGPGSKEVVGRRGGPVNWEIQPSLIRPSTRGWWGGLCERRWGLVGNTGGFRVLKRRKNAGGCEDHGKNSRGGNEVHNEVMELQKKKTCRCLGAQLLTRASQKRNVGGLNSGH